MQSLLLQCLFVIAFVYLTHAAVLKSAMINNYPQIAVLGCDSQKANLYYDTERRVWVEHLVSSCVNSEQSILEFCQQAYPSLNIANIVRLDTVLRFENWCELISPIDENGNNIHRCKQGTGTEEVVQPFRCLYIGDQREELIIPSNDCSANSIVGTGECFRAEKWQQLGSIECANRKMLLNHSLMTLDWCGLAAFRGIEFVCCPLKNVESKQIIDYETSLDEQDKTLIEDDPIRDLNAIPFAAESAQPSEELRRLEPPLQKSIAAAADSTTAAPHRRILAMSLGSREPTWMEDYRRWNTDSAYFADDEDTTDDQDDNKSIVSKYQLAMNEHERFTKDKEDFKRKYKEQFESLKSRWQSRQNQLQLFVNSVNASENQIQFEKDFRQEYDLLKQTASRERTRINELHEIHLDTAINAAKDEANTLLIAAWNEKPIKTETLQQALYNYLHVLLRDRIHLVNRYERLRAVDPQQATRKQPSIHARLRLIAERINDAIKQLNQNSKLQAKIQPRIDGLFSEYDEVNQAAEKLLIKFASMSSTTTSRPRFLPLGRDETKIYPFSKKTSTTTIATNKPDENNAEYDYATNDEYEDDDEDEDMIDENKKSTSKITTTTVEPDAINYDQIETNDGEWDLDEDVDGTFNVKTDPNNDEQNSQVFVNENDIRPLMPDNGVRRGVRTIFVTYLPYALCILMIICLLIGALVFRCMMQRRAHRHGGKYEKNYVFTEVESCTPEDKALHALQINGYENPTYKFFETQTQKC